MNGPICVRCGQAITTMPVATPAGYQHDRCPSKTPTGLIVGLLGCGGLILLVFFAMIGLGVWQYLEPGKPVPVATATATPEALSQTFAAKNGLFTVHYPENYAASTPGDHDVILRRPLPGGAEIGIVVTAVPNPVSDQLEELDRLARLELPKQFPGYVAGPLVPGTCHQHPGLHSQGSFTSAGIAFENRACAFMIGAHYHRCYYAAPADQLAELEPLLERICDAVEIR
jgi:hypothetical protein